MVSTDYSIKFDRLGFPLIRYPEWHHEIGLLPVSKYQFERFMVASEPRGALTDDWYRERLALNPRCAWQRYRDHPWQLFLSGVEQTAITPFLRHLGPDYRLPSAIEWKALLNVTEQLLECRAEIAAQCRLAAVRQWIEAGLAPACRECLLEPVMDRRKVRYIGRPVNALLPNTWQPDSLRDIHDWNLVRQAVGFRVARDAEILSHVQTAI